MAAASRIYRCAVAPFHIPLPDAVERLLQVTRAGGGNPLVVGGAVRDAALGAAPKDIDLEVHGIGIDQLAQCYRSSGYQVDEVGRAFGVLKIGGDTIRDLDIAVPRRDNKTGAGHRGFAVVLDEELTVEEAASRRDFTINALLYDPHHKVLLDPFSGAEDLQSRTLRHVSDHFGEDPLRVLRGVQLAGRFGLTLHPETAALCRRLRPAFADLPVERVQTEWAKLWTKGRHPAAAVQA
jgi:tRNA nucleotidyltransferase (CCA-adding enzyme)